MSIDIGSVFQDGIDAFLSRKSVVLMAVFVAFGVFSSIAGDTLGFAILDRVTELLLEQGETLPPEAQAQLEQQRRQLGWALDVGLGPAIVLIVASFFVGELVRLGAVRALADDSTDSLERRHYAKNVASIFLNRILAGIITFILLAITAVVTIVAPAAIFPPLVLLTIVPFFYVFIGLYFASFAVTIDEVGALDGVARGWEYAKGNRIKLALIAIAVGIIQFVIGIPTLLFVDFGAAAGEGLGTTIQRTPVALVITAVIGGINSVFQLALASQTYVHLGNRSGDAQGPTRTNDDEFAGETQF